MGLAKQSVKQARRIKPRRIAKMAEQKFSLLVIGADAEDRDALVSFFVPLELAGAERDHALACVQAALADDVRLEEYRSSADIVVFTPRARATANGQHGEGPTLDPADAYAGAMELLRRYPNFLLALARRFPRLRGAAATALIQAAAMRNAAVAALSAIPEVVPSPVGLVWAVGEFASDTVVLTSNQIRLALQLAAIQGEAVGWLDQSSDILFILVGAFGWRALARSLVALVPGGAGLVAKSGIAYGGTVAVGRFLWRRALPRYGSAEPEPARTVLERLAPGRWQPRRLPRLAGRAAS